MLAQLKAAWPAYAKALSEFAPLFEISPGQSALNLIEQDRSEASENELMRTQNAQSALGLIESSLLKALETSGIQADIHVGHSYGELVALHAAGYYDVATLAKLSRARGEILGNTSEKRPSRMVAVRADAKTVESAIAPYKGIIELANINSPKQTVVGGRADAIDMFIAKCEGMGVKAIPLKTAAAFHTSLMEPAVAPWTMALKEILHDQVRSSSRRVLANWNVKAYENDANSLIHNLSQQVASPVQWVKTIEELYASGVRVFLEVGPGKALTSLCASILEGKTDILCLTLDPGSQAQDLAQFINTLKTKIEQHINPKPKSTLPNPSSPTESTGSIELMRRYLEVSESVTVQMAKDLPMDQKQVALDQYLKSTEAVMQTFLRAQTGGASLSLVPPLSSPAASPAPSEPAAPTPLSWLKTKLAQTTGFAESKIDETQAFDSFGIDSITLMEALANLIDTFPYLASKKSQLYAIRCLRDLQGFEENSSETKATPLAWLKKKLALVTGYAVDRIDETKGFDSFGIDSITMMECLAELIEAFPDLKPHKNALYSLKNLSELKAYAVDEQASSPRVKSAGGEKKAKSRKRSSRFSPIVNRIISRLVLSFATTVRRKPEEFVLHANLERDLSIDAFTRQEAIEDVLRAYPRFALAGQALMNVTSLGELGELLDRFDDLRSISLSPSIAQAARTGHKGVERFVLKTMREPTVAMTSSIQIPEDILLVGFEGPFLQNLKATIEHQGSEVQVLSFDEKEWSLERYPTKVSRFDTEALAEILQKGGHDEALRFVIFVLETDDSELLSEGSNAWKKQLDKGPLALFELAKAMKFAHLFDRGDSLSLLGLEAGNTAWQATRGTLKSIGRENSQLICTSLRLHLSASRISRRKILETLITHQGQHEIYLSSSQLTLKVLEHEPLSHVEKMALPKDALVLISGGARGVSAALALELVRQYPSLRIAAMGRSPYPDSGDTSESARALRETEEKVRSAGGRFIYLSCDVRDEEKLSACIDLLISEHGPVHGYIHGAGVSDDTLMSRKSFESFNKVLETKALTLPLLFQKLKDQPLSFVVFLSSLSALNGTPGQTDYAAANEALNAVAELWQSQLNCKVTSMLWSVWGETGLAGDDLVHRMIEAGLDPIATEDGVRNFVLELGNPSRDSWVLLSPFSTLYYALEIEKEHFALPEGVA